MTNQWHSEGFFKAGKIAWNKSISIIISYTARKGGPAGESVGGFSPTMAHKIFGANSSFRVEWRTAGRVRFLFFGSLLLVLTKL